MEVDRVDDVLEEEIPPPRPRELSSKLDTYVVIDLETTGLGMLKSKEIPDQRIHFSFIFFFIFMFSCCPVCTDPPQIL